MTQYDLKTLTETGKTEDAARSALEALLPRDIGSKDYAVQPDIKTALSNGVYVAVTTYQLKTPEKDKVVRSGGGAYKSALERKLNGQ